MKMSLILSQKKLCWRTTEEHRCF